MGRNLMSTSTSAQDMRHIKTDTRIGIVADTHEASDPQTLVERLEEQHCDFYVHLGDIGGSKLTNKLVHEYKQTLGNLDHLSPADRERFEQLRSQGLTPIWSYIEMRMGGDSELRRQRLIETGDSYALVIGAMSRLHPVYLLSGNVDRALANADNVRPSFERYGIPLVTEPMLVDLGDQAAALWPSMKVLTEEFAQHLEEVVNGFVGELQSKKRVVVLAHEQLFKGPPPKKYIENVERAGYKALTVPYFEPNPTWRQLLRLFRSLPTSVDLVFVHGHVHDPCQVIQAGAPYLRGTSELGLEYRLYGLASAGCDGAAGRGRRTVRIFCVPANEAMVLVLGRQRARIESIGVDAWTNISKRRF